MPNEHAGQASGSDGDVLRSSTGHPRSRYIGSLQKAGQILRLFSAEQPMIRVAMVSRAIGANRSTASRLLATMAEVGLVVRDEGGVGYRPGPIVLQLAPLASRLDLRTSALSHMRALQVATTESVSLHVRVEMHRVCIDSLPGPQELHATAQIGAPRPLHAGAQGKVLLAYVSETELEAYIASGLQRYTDLTICDPEALRTELKAICDAGVAFSRGESTPHVASVAAPIRDVSGVVASLACSGPAVRWTEETMRSWASHITAAATDVSRALGYRPRPPDEVGSS